MIVFRLDTLYGTPDIVEVECTRVTYGFVFIGVRRQARIAQYHQYFEDYDSAKRAAIEFAQKKIVAYKRSIEENKQNIEKFEAYLVRMHECDDNTQEN